MPYIKEENRNKLNCRDIFEPDTAGELNYCLTKYCLDYIKVKGKSYQSINDVVGALEGAKLEFYRRFAAPYEDLKIKENGDVY